MSDVDIAVLARTVPIRLLEGSETEPLNFKGDPSNHQGRYIFSAPAVSPLTNCF
jgi:hypothetical protein